MSLAPALFFWYFCQLDLWVIAQCHNFGLCLDYNTIIIGHGYKKISKERTRINVYIRLPPIGCCGFSAHKHLYIVYQLPHATCSKENILPT